MWTQHDWALRGVQLGGGGEEGGIPRNRRNPATGRTIGPTLPPIGPRIPLRWSIVSASSRRGKPRLQSPEFQEAIAAAYAAALVEVEQRVAEEVRRASDTLLKDACNSASRTGVRSCRLIFESVGPGREAPRRRRR